jgi:hypothetical protein
MNPRNTRAPSRVKAGAVSGGLTAPRLAGHERHRSGEGGQRMGNTPSMNSRKCWPVPQAWIGYAMRETTNSRKQPQTPRQPLNLKVEGSSPSRPMALSPQS